MRLRGTVLVLFVALGIATAAFAADVDWPMARYDEAQSGFTPQHLDLPLTLSWQHNTTKFADNTSAPAVVGGVVYFASGNRLYAVDAATGALKWVYPSSDALSFNIKTGITVWEDLVLFGGTDGTLYAVRAADGRTAWAFPTRGPIRSSPIVSGGTVFVGSDDNSLYALDASTGEMIWTGGFRTNDDVQATPALTPGLVIFASMDTNVYAANVATGRTRWSYRLPMSPIRSAPVISGNLAYIATGHAISALSTKNGQPRYTINLPSDVVASPAVAGNDLYVLCRDRKLYSYIAGTVGPKPKWAQPAVLGQASTTPPTVAGDIVFVGCLRGLICAYSAEDGHLLWSYTVAPSNAGNTGQRSDFTNLDAPLVVADGALFALTDDGALHCFTSRAPDNTPPKIYNVTPTASAAMSGSPPITVSAIIYDESTGVDPASVELLLDKEKVEYKFDPTKLLLRYDTPVTQPLRPLADGRHNLTILAKDWKGNQLEYAWSFIVDNTLPPRTPPRAATQTPQPTTPQRDRRGRTGRSRRSETPTPPAPLSPPSSSPSVAPGPGAPPAPPPMPPGYRAPPGPPAGGS